MVLTGSAVKLFLDKFKVSKFTQVSVKKKKPMDKIQNKYQNLNNKSFIEDLYWYIHVHVCFFFND